MKKPLLLNALFCLLVCQLAVPLPALAKKAGEVTEQAKAEKATQQEDKEEQSKKEREKRQLSVSRLVFGARTFFGMRSEDPAYELDLYFLAERPLWQVALKMPLFGLIGDRPPATATYKAMGLLKSHWDDPGDFGRIIGTLRIGNEAGPALLLLGRESGRTIYQGTLIDNLYTQLNPDSAGLVLRAEFQGKLGELGILVAEPFNPALVAIYGAVRPLATVFKERPNLSSLAVNLAAFIDPTVMGDTANYGLGMEIEESFFIKNVFITPFTAYTLNYKRSAIGAGLKIGYEDRASQEAKRFEAAISVLGSENYPQAVGAFYFVERAMFIPRQQENLTYLAALDAWPDEWHAALKFKARFTWPNHLFAQYTMLLVPAVGQGEGVLHVQGSFLSRFSLGTILMLKRYAPVYGDGEAVWSFLASLEGTVNIWRGITASAAYSYLINDDSIAAGSGPAHQFLFGIGYEFGLGKKSE